MSPQNCSAKMSPPSIRSSPQKRRGSDERVGVKVESERNPSDACGAADHRGSGNRNGILGSLRSLLLTIASFCRSLAYHGMAVTNRIRRGALSCHIPRKRTQTDFQQRQRPQTVPGHACSSQQALSLDLSCLLPHGQSLSPGRQNARWQLVQRDEAAQWRIPAAGSSRSNRDDRSAQSPKMRHGCVSLLLNIFVLSKLPSHAVGAN